MSATRRSDYDKVLQTVSEGDLPLTVQEIAERADVAKITVRRHLSTALSNGAVTRDFRRAPKPPAAPKATGGRLPYEYRPIHSTG